MGKEKEIQNRVKEAFIKRVVQHGDPKWAIAELDYMIFTEHKEEFWSLTEEEQWQVRSIFNGIKQMFC